MNERPLVAFTLLSQTAVGAVLTLGALDRWAATLAGESAARALTDGLLLAIGPVVGLALFSSLMHLGTPRNAWRAAANLRTSWLSREIVCAGLFAGSGAAFALLRWSGAGSAGLRTQVALVAGAAGVAFVYAMARVYRLRTVPRWDTPLTTVSFFATALLLGPLAVGTGLVLLPGLPRGGGPRYAARRAPAAAGRGRRAVRGPAPERCALRAGAGGHLRGSPRGAGPG
jgi:DMSO reductase anchor subunit